MRTSALWLTLKRTGPYALVPPVLVGVVLPLGLTAVSARAIPELTAFYLDITGRLLVPALASWWPAFVFRERAEGDGREFLYCLKPRGEVLTALLLALLYVGVLVPYALLAQELATPGPDFLPMLVARSVLISSLTFSMVFLLGSGVLALVGALIVSIIGLPAVELVIGGFAGMLPLEPASTALPLLSYAVLTAMLLGVGEHRSRRFTG